MSVAGRVIRNSAALISWEGSLKEGDLVAITSFLGRKLPFLAGIPLGTGEMGGRASACPSAEGWPYRNLPGQSRDSCLTWDKVVISDTLPSASIIQGLLSGTRLNVGGTSVNSSKVTPLLSF